MRKLRFTSCTKPLSGSLSCKNQDLPLRTFEFMTEQSVLFVTRTNYAHNCAYFKPSFVLKGQGSLHQLALNEVQFILNDKWISLFI